MAQKASAKTALRIQNEEKALALRASGATYAQIGKQIDLTEVGARKMVLRVLGRLTSRANESAEQVLELELMRLDRMLLGLWPQAKQGNQGAVDRVLRIQERRAKYLGLDAPVRREVSGPEGGPIKHEYDFSHLTDEELERAIAEAEGADGGEASEGAAE